MEDELHKRIVGQDEAVISISRAIRRTRAGLKDPKRPGGSFIFLGPTGVGKTEFAKTLAEFLFDDEDALIQLDMSEYMEKHSVSRLVGSPPGYIGYDEGGQLTEAVRRKPFSVVLFDEVEKAHPDVFNTLLQILEDGRLTDAQGRAVDFKNTILIMTSNLGTADLRKAAIGFGRASDVADHERMKEKVHAALKTHFRPEFLNRIDDTIVFHELSREEVIMIADMFIARLRDQLAVQGLGLELSAAAQGFLAEKGYDPELGARPLRRAVQQYVEDALSEKILFKEFHAGQTIVGDIAEGPDGPYSDLRRRRRPAALGRLRRPLRQRLRSQRTPSLTRVKTHSVHVCRECGTTSPRWSGRCSGCGEWNTLDEERIDPSTSRSTTTTDVPARRRRDHGRGALDRRRRTGPRAGRRLHRRIDDAALRRARRRKVDARPHVAARLGRARHAGAVDRGRGVGRPGGPTGPSTR